MARQNGPGSEHEHPAGTDIKSRIPNSEVFVGAEFENEDLARSLDILSAAWRSHRDLGRRRRTHGFASPPYDGFAISRIKTAHASGAQAEKDVQ